MKSPHDSAVESVFNILPSKLYRDATSANDHVLDLVEHHLKDLLRSIETVLDIRRCKIHVEEKEKTEEIVPFDEPSCINRILQKDTGMIERTAAQSMPTQVLHQVAMSGFLTAGDLGRLLFLTSKTILQDLGEDFCYYHLCRKRWNNSTAIPSVIKKRGGTWMYRKLSQGLESPLERQWPVLPEPSLSLDNLALMVNMYSGSQEMVSEILRGESLRELFRCGRSYLPLSNPIVIGDFPIQDDGRISPPNVDFEDWSASMHAVRLDNHKCCCVHQSSDVWWYFKGDLDNRAGNLHFSPELTGLELTDQGKALECRIREFDRVMNNQPFEGIYFEATVMSSTYPSPDDPKKMRFALNRLKVEIWSIYEYAGDVFVSECESKSHGVTALHLLEHLKGLEVES
jgi:hypothetical protein